MSVPTRIQLSRRRGWKMTENTVKVDQSHELRTPFPVVMATSTIVGKTTDVWCVGTWDGPGMWFKDTEVEARELAVKAYRAWITSPAQRPLLERARFALRGRNIASWCKRGFMSHIDVLLEISNDNESNRANAA